MGTARALPAADREGRGAGLLDVKKADATNPPRNGQAWSRGSGTGTLEGARGGSYATDGGVALSGEIDIFGRPWSSRTWATAAATENAWQAGTYLGFAYAGDSWGGSSFASQTWQARSWRTGSWTARSWRTTSY